MYDADDIARSIRRIVAAMVEEPWRIALERVEVKDDGRPAGYIEVGQSRVRFSRTSIPQGNVVMFCPVSIALYPSLAAPREAGRTARVLSDGLIKLMAFGADGPVFASGRPASGPERIPLYDYSPVALVEADPESDPPARTPPEFPHDVLWVEDYGSRPIQDPDDPRRWSVMMDMRVSWEQPGRVGPEASAPIATGLPGLFGGEPVSP